MKIQVVLVCRNFAKYYFVKRNRNKKCFEILSQLVDNCSIQIIIKIFLITKITLFVEETNLWQLQSSTQLDHSCLPPNRGTVPSTRLLLKYFFVIFSIFKFNLIKIPIDGLVMMIGIFPEYEFIRSSVNAFV